MNFNALHRVIRYSTFGWIEAARPKVNPVVHRHSRIDGRIPEDAEVSDLTDPGRLMVQIMSSEFLINEKLCSGPLNLEVSVKMALRCTRRVFGQFGKGPIRKILTSAP